ncbi:HYD1 signature containing ADP-ribosyltransferase family protein [Prauserella halophila]|uniref:HYD1 signature containing ADP-ribosyltransferase family protein n=1 Tax=Prauserella halophila TaxID=185641 RepID=UPI0020A2B95E|nr:HYD1 signature containing ADP-ribosyltransferase family protein [Prauserella halophila]
MRLGVRTPTGDGDEPYQPQQQPGGAAEPDGVQSSHLIGEECAAGGQVRRNGTGWECTALEDGDTAQPGSISNTRGQPYGFSTDAGAGPRTLYHYTDDAGLKGILDSKRLNPSLRSVNPKDVRYGNGQYVSDIVPGTRTCAQLSRCFLGQPFQGRQFENYVEIDVRGLNVIKGRDGVYVIPGELPLDISRRLTSSGTNR